MTDEKNGPQDEGLWKTKQKRTPPEIDALLCKNRERLDGIPEGTEHATKAEADG
jgi:hypothetical protein